MALERHHHLHGIPTVSDSAMEVVRSLDGSQPGLFAAAGHSSGSRPSSLLVLGPSKRPASAAGTGHGLSGSLSASGSDTSSSVFTYSSPGSSRMDHRPNSSLFSGSHEVSPTTASFSSSRPSPSIECSHEGWTEEPIPMLEREHLSSLPEERSPRRPSTSSAAITSPSLVSKSWTKGATPAAMEPTTDYRNDTRINTPVKSKVYSSSTLKTPPSTNNTKRLSIVSGLKKLGDSLRSTTSSKTSPKMSLSNTENSALNSPLASASTTDEVQIVSANPPSRPSFSPPPLFSNFSFADQQTSGAATQALSSPADWGKTTCESGQFASSARRPSQTSEHDREIETLGTRLLSKKRNSGIASISRSSSRASNIQHTSFDEARRPGVHAVDWSRRQSVHPDQSHDEEREELKGDCSPTSSPRQSLVPSPVRPSRHTSNSPAPQSGSPYSTRASLELNFNAAHDKRWSKSVSSFQADRRGSDASTTGALASRRGSDSSSQHGAPRALRIDEHRNSVTSMPSNRTSWHKSSVKDGYGPNQSHPPTSVSARRSSLQRHSSQKASQSLMGRPASRKQSLNSAHISRPTSLVSTSSDIASKESASNQDYVAMIPAAPDSITSSISMPSNLVVAPRTSRSAGSTLEAKRPTFGLDLQPDAAAAFDSIPYPRPMGVRAASTPTLAGLSNLEGSSAPLSVPNEGFPHTPDGEEESRDEHERREAMIIAAAFSSSSSTPPSPRRLPSDTPQSPVLEELELLDDDHSSSICSIDSTTKATSTDTPFAFRYINGTHAMSSTSSPTTKTLSHSRSQDHFQWSKRQPLVGQITPRMERPRSSSYTYV